MSKKLNKNKVIGINTINENAKVIIVAEKYRGKSFNLLTLFYFYFYTIV
jgi:hypothetical protein